MMFLRLKIHLNYLFIWSVAQIDNYNEPNDVFGKKIFNNAQIQNNVSFIKYYDDLSKIKLEEIKIINFSIFVSNHFLLNVKINNLLYWIN